LYGAKKKRYKESKVQMGENTREKGGEAQPFTNTGDDCTDKRKAGKKRGAKENQLWGENRILKANLTR